MDTPHFTPLHQTRSKFVCRSQPLGNRGGNPVSTPRLVLRTLLHRSVFVVGAMLFAVGAVWWANAVVKREQATTTPAEPETVEIWVAAKDLPAGALLTRARLPDVATKKTFT